MLKVKIISVGKLKEKSLQALINEYEKRLSRYIKLEMVEINDLPVPENPSAGEIEEILTKEAMEISKKISPKAYIVTMCIEGKKLNSVEFSKVIDSATLSYPEIDFIIGSSHGLSDTIKKQSNYRLSMSDMTFPHNLAKLMLTEQIYRAFKIIKGESYHK